MALEIKEVCSIAELRTFIRLPAAIHRDHRNWMPVIYQDEWSFFNPRKNRSFSYCDTVMFLAFRRGKPVGRIMGIINNRHNERIGGKTARFGYLECYHDQEISHALISRVEAWAVSRGMSKMIGPYGFSDKDPQGLQIEGFEYPPVIAAPCNEPYLVSLVEAEGYGKEVDCIMFRYHLDRPLPPLYDRIFRRCLSNPEYSMFEPASKRALRPYVLPILRMVNETYSQIYGFVPMDEQEMKELAARYMPVIDPRFVKIILFHGQVVAFILGLPNLTRGIQRSRGYLFPIGFLHILLAARSARQLDLMLGGVLPAHRGKGLELYMGMQLIQAATAAGYSHLEIHLVLETNTRMIAEMEKAGASPHKRFRVFGKPL